jgi:hypothetical protein
MTLTASIGCHMAPCENWTTADCDVRPSSSGERRTPLIPARPWGGTMASRGLVLSCAILTGCTTTNTTASSVAAREPAPRAVDIMAISLERPPCQRACRGTVVLLRRNGPSSKMVHQTNGRSIQCEVKVTSDVFDSLAASLIGGGFFYFRPRYASRRLHQTTSAIVAKTSHDTMRVSRYGAPSDAPRLLFQIEAAMDSVVIQSGC